MYYIYSICIYFRHWHKNKDNANYIKIVFFSFKKFFLTEQPYGVIEISRSSNRPLGDAKEQVVKCAFST